MAARRTEEIIARMQQQYGTEPICYLHHKTDWQLLVAVILSAQCTDARVNLVTKDLFAHYDTLEKLASAKVEEVEEEIRSIGFYRSKAPNIIGCARLLLERHGGVVPRSLEELTALPGVGRKTANVIRGNIYKDPSIVVDTHVKRISKRLGLTKEEDPTKVEFDLMRRLPKNAWILWNMHVITFGRTICQARNPKCQECFLQDLCKAKDKCVTKWK